MSQELPRFRRLRRRAKNPGRSSAAVRAGSGARRNIAAIVPSRAQGRPGGRPACSGAGVSSTGSGAVAETGSCVPLVSAKATASLCISAVAAGTAARWCRRRSRSRIRAVGAGGEVHEHVELRARRAGRMHLCQAADGNQALRGGVRHHLVGQESAAGRHRRAAHHLNHVDGVLRGGEREEVDRVTGIHRGLRVAEELRVQRGARRHALRGEARVDLRRERRGVLQQRVNSPARHGERTGGHQGIGRHRQGTCRPRSLPASGRRSGWRPGSCRRPAMFSAGSARAKVTRSATPSRRLSREVRGSSG